ncbi:unnamed protein product [Amoebophrya sp. A120]|nr:unnamed protein product [Amoebophrya sp. A120]|eukprot:GSA120T00025567001.1
MITSIFRSNDETSLRSTRRPPAGELMTLSKIYQKDENPPCIFPELVTSSSLLRSRPRFKNVNFHDSTTAHRLREKNPEQKVERTSQRSRRYWWSQSEVTRQHGVMHLNKKDAGRVDVSNELIFEFQIISEDSIKKQESEKDVKCKMR